MRAKLVSVCTVAYALSPFDLIPNSIPLLGYLDDLIIVSALIWLFVNFDFHISSSSRNGSLYFYIFSFWGSLRNGLLQQFTHAQARFNCVAD
jgi:uncharacterized membrane protein YkvA (DUF1232 family)